MYCIEEKILFRLFGARGIGPPSLGPWCDTSQQSPELWNPQNPECRTTSPDWENTTNVSRPCIQNAQRKTGEASPAG